MQATQISNNKINAVRCISQGRVGRSIKSPMRPLHRPRTAIKAEKDFDALLMESANKWEKAENKVAIAGYLTAAILSIFTAEWFIHLPLFNVLLGFPIQFLGLMSAVNLGLKYYVDKEGEPFDDFEALVNNVSKRLPGL